MNSVNPSGQGTTTLSSVAEKASNVTLRRIISLAVITALATDYASLTALAAGPTPPELHEAASAAPTKSFRDRNLKFL